MTSGGGGVWAVMALSTEWWRTSGGHCQRRGVTSEDDHWLGWVGKRGERADGPTARLPPTAGGSGV
jgi:hypothetical protein